MSVFTFKARTQEGKAIEGQLEAATAEEVARKLKHEGFLPTKISEKKPQSPEWRPGGSGVDASQMILFNNQLANLIGAGVSLLASLNIISKVVANKRLKEILDQLSHRIASGSSFSESLAEHPKVFAKLFISMVKAGELGGKLSLVLNRYAHYLEVQEEIRQKVKNALLYPALLLSFGVIVIIYILSTVIPRFVDIFFKAGVALPWPTKVLYSTGLLFKDYWGWMLAGLAFLILSIAAFKRTTGGREFFDRLELSVPLIGPLKRKIYMSRFSRSLATMLESGVSLLTSLDIIGEIIENTLLSKAILETRQKVEQGEPLAKPLESNGQFPADIVQMVTVGEEAGQLGHMLNKAADYYDSYIDYTIKRLLVLIEPILIIFMAGLIGLIMASVILPLFDMVKTIR